MPEVNAALSVIVVVLLFVYLAMRGRGTEASTAPGIDLSWIARIPRPSASNVTVFRRRVSVDFQSGRLRGTAQRGSTCRVCGLRFDHPQHREHRQGA